MKSWLHDLRFSVVQCDTHFEMKSRLHDLRFYLNTGYKYLMDLA